MRVCDHCKKKVSAPIEFSGAEFCSRDCIVKELKVEIIYWIKVKAFCLFAVLGFLAGFVLQAVRIKGGG